MSFSCASVNQRSIENMIEEEDEEEDIQFMRFLLKKKSKSEEFDLVKSFGEVLVELLDKHRSILHSDTCTIKQKLFLEVSSRLFIDPEEPTPRWLMATDTMDTVMLRHRRFFALLGGLLSFMRDFSVKLGLAASVYVCSFVLVLFWLKRVPTWVTDTMDTMDTMAATLDTVTDTMDTMDMGDMDTMAATLDTVVPPERIREN
ncbi:hypothetical protein LWI29_006818 [Acer saccharum]|uniref:Uncharacterized protein n=1 Tax=Acer saccharum TaxID=4024 RepID=A0AA39SWP8_ACESA|nr:hypothetical protein LWI29_006818 [Acer saccharum]